VSLDLLPSDVETDLRATLRQLLAERCQPGAVTATYDGDRSVVAPLWRALTQELGLAGLLVPEERGGAGASAREAAAVLEELGRAVAPVPYLTSAVIATTALLRSDGDLLAELAAGERTAALLTPLSTAPDDPLPVLARAADGGAWRALLKTDGSARRVGDGAAGNWRVDEQGRLCTSFPDDRSCWRLVRDGGSEPSLRGARPGETARLARPSPEL